MQRKRSPIGSLTVLGLALSAAAGGAFGAAASGARAADEEKQAASPVTTQRLVFAHYFYNYQGDPRKAVPYRNIRDKQGLTLMTDHPWESVGPWMSFDRSMWHKNQFQMM